MPPINRGPFNALLDDDGSNTLGTIFGTDDIKNVILDPVDAAIAPTDANVATNTNAITTLQGQVTPPTTGISNTGTINNWALTPGFYHWTGTADLTVTGIAAASDGATITLRNRSTTSAIYLSHLNGGSSAANQMTNYVTSGTTPIAPRGYATLRYSTLSGATGWFLVAHKQGTWLTVPYAAGNFTTNGAGGCTVDAGDVATQSYYLHGTTLLYAVKLQGVTITAPTSSEFRIALPSTYLPTKIQDAFVFLIDNSTQKTTALCGSQTAVGYLRVFLDSAGSNWTPANNTTFLSFNTQLEVA